MIHYVALRDHLYTLWALLEFIRAGEYRRLADPVVNRCATALKIVSLL